LSHQSVGFRAALARYDVIGRVEVDGIDLISRDERIHIDGVHRRQVERLEVFIGDFHPLAAGVLVALGDLIPFQPAVPLLAGSLIVDPLTVFGVDQVQVDLLLALPAHSGVKLDWNRDHTEADGTAPD
jgi:hypothetical protein